MRLETLLLREALKHCFPHEMYPFSQPYCKDGLSYKGSPYKSVYKDSLPYKGFPYKSDYKDALPYKSIYKDPLPYKWILTMDFL